jgi:hypothetical protein
LIRIIEPSITHGIVEDSRLLESGKVGCAEIEVVVQLRNLGGNAPYLPPAIHIPKMIRSLPRKLVIGNQDISVLLLVLPQRRVPRISDS